MYENSDSQFLRTTTGIQSVPEASYESKLIMTFLTKVEFAGIMCSFRLVLEEKAGTKLTWVIKIRVLWKVFRNQFCFIRYRRQHLRAVIIKEVYQFTCVENIINNSPEVTWAKFLGKDRLLFYHHRQVWKLHRPLCNDY